MNPYRLDAERQRREWRTLLTTIEQRLILGNKHVGMLAEDLSDYLYVRSTGHIGSLMELIRRGCTRAIRTGVETLNRQLLERSRSTARRSRHARNSRQLSEPANSPGSSGRRDRWPPSRFAPSPCALPPSPVKRSTRGWKPPRTAATSPGPTCAPRSAPCCRPPTTLMRGSGGSPMSSPASSAPPPGVDPAALRAMTLEAYPPLAAGVDPQTGQPASSSPWRHIHASRFCPLCLAENGGRWKLVWRTVWFYACPTHHCLLADSCPECGAAQRSRSLAAVVPQPGRCSATVGPPPTWNPARCGADLARAPVTALEKDSPVLAVQSTVTDALINGHADFGIYQQLPIPVPQVLADLRVLGECFQSDVDRQT